MSRSRFTRTPFGRAPEKSSENTSIPIRDRDDTVPPWHRFRPQCLAAIQQSTYVFTVLFDVLLSLDSHNCSDEGLEVWSVVPPRDGVTNPFENALSERDGVRVPKNIRNITRRITARISKSHIGGWADFIWFPCRSPNQPVQHHLLLHDQVHAAQQADDWPDQWRYMLCTGPASFKFAMPHL